MKNNKVTLLDSVLRPTEFSELSLFDALNDISSDKYKHKITRLRSIAEKELQKKYKLTLPGLIFNGTFSEKADNAGFSCSSGLFHFDIDGLDNVDDAKAILCCLPSMVFCFVSPSGNGVKAALRVADDAIKSDADFKRYYPHVEAEILKHGFSIDKSCKDVRRLCFVSHDPEIYINYNAEIFCPDLQDNIVVKKPAPTKPAQQYQAPKNDRDFCLTQLNKKMMSGIAGTRHATRFEAGRLAGGYIAAGRIGYDDALSVLMAASDSIADGGVTTQAETKTIENGIKAGMDAPLYYVDPIAKRVDVDYSTMPEDVPSVFDSLSDSPPMDYVADISSFTEDDAQEWIPDISGEIDYIIPFDSIARDIQLWILRTSVKPQPGLAFLASMCVLSTLFGRQSNYDGIKGNLTCIGIAASGEGKDWPIKAARKILAAVGYGHCFAAQMASGAALFQQVQENPSTFMVVDEFGHYFAGISGKNSGTHTREIMPMITEMSTSAGDFYQQKKLKDTEAGVIIEPNLVVLGATTEGQILNAVTKSDAADGSLARFMTVFGESDLPINHDRESGAVVPPEIIARIQKELDFRGVYKELGGSEYIRNVSKEYKAEKRRIEDEFNRLAIECGKAGGDKALFKPFYHRLAVRAVSMSLLVDRCLSHDVLRFFAGICEQSMTVFIKKFCHLAADNENERQAKIVEAAIKEAGKAGIIHKVLISRTRQVNPLLRERILKDLIDSHAVFIVKKRVDGSRKPSTFYFWKK